MFRRFNVRAVGDVGGFRAELLKVKPPHLISIGDNDRKCRCRHFCRPLKVKRA